MKIMRVICLVGAILLFSSAQAQNYKLAGSVKGNDNRQSLPGVNVTWFINGNISGVVTNEEGFFSFNSITRPDSVKFSMIGYNSIIYRGAGLPAADSVTVTLHPASIGLREVVIRSLSAFDIVKRAVKQLPLFIPAGNFESNAFYREVIRDSAHYYSVAEAIFKAQFFVQNKSLKLKLDKGRSKEDVEYTQLFDDYHPGGGPEDAMQQSLTLRTPEFLSASGLKNYDFKIDSTMMQDNDLVYVISFDQKPGIKEALEKGTIYIDANDFSVSKFQAKNSPAGTPYIKSLRGTDKLFAKLLNIDLEVKGWSKEAAFTKIGGKLFLNNAKLSYRINYKQPKKHIDLKLLINTDLQVTDFQKPLVTEISKSEEWKRKNMVANLPSDFDRDFWGGSNVLNPTQEIRDVISSLTEKNKDLKNSPPVDGWSSLNKAFFVSYQNHDSLTLIPIAKCNWSDNETGGMLYKTVKGNFSLEAHIDIRQRKNSLKEPDKGFQQAGIILRNPAANKENYLLLSLGTGGSEAPKQFIKSTAFGKTKTLVAKTGGLSGWLRIEKKGKVLNVYHKTNDAANWIKAGNYEVDWADQNLQAGLSVMARFAGDGPKQHPDMKAVFSKVKIEKM